MQIKHSTRKKKIIKMGEGKRKGERERGLVFSVFAGV
jgi:hypothetical protein